MNGIVAASELGIQQPQHENERDTPDYQQYCQQRWNEVTSLANQVEKTKGQLSPEQIALTVHTLQYLKDHAPDVAPFIHDVWSGEHFRQGFMWGEQTNRALLRHNLLRPYNELANQALENTLIEGDLEAIRQELSIGGRDQEGTAGGISTENLPQVLEALLVLSKDQTFVEGVARRTHESWVSAHKGEGKTVADDPRLGDFASLSVADRENSIINARNDINRIPALKSGDFTPTS